MGVASGCPHFLAACCGKKLPLSYLIIAGVVGLVLAAMLGSLLSRQRR